MLQCAQPGRVALGASVGRARRPDCRGLASRLVRSLPEAGSRMSTVWQVLCSRIVATPETREGSNPVGRVSSCGIRLNRYPRARLRSTGRVTVSQCQRCENSD